MTDTVTGFLGRVRQAWDDGDAQAYGAQFSDDASYVIFLGDALSGRDEITRTHYDVFTRWQKGTRMRVEPISVHAVTDDVTVVVTVGGIGRDNPIEYDKFQTYVLRRRDGRFECVAFQNTEMSSRAKKTHNA